MGTNRHDAAKTSTLTRHMPANLAQPYLWEMKPAICKTAKFRMTSDWDLTWSVSIQPSARAFLSFLTIFYTYGQHWHDKINNYGVKIGRSCVSRVEVIQWRSQVSDRKPETGQAGAAHAQRDRRDKARKSTGKHWGNGAEYKNTATLTRQKVKQWL